MGFDERIDVGSPWWGEHVSRYDFASRLAHGRVLDVACGTGYGLSILQRHAGEVVGVDIDPDALARAAIVIDPTRVQLRQADATALPFESSHFDVITSFETLEHLEKRREFLLEMARVLRSDGVFIVSTPNAIHTRPVDGRPRNPFHRYEYRPDELRTALAEMFGEVELLGQTVDARFIVPAFEWDQMFVEDPTIRANILVRRLLHRLPRRARDSASRALWGHDFFPAAEDYRFVAPEIAGVSNLIAACRAPRRST